MLPEALKSLRPRQQKVGPVWEGPDSNGEQGGITQSLLKDFLVCKERLRIKVVDGWEQADRFSFRMEYGNMWHVCEEAHAAGNEWEQPLQEYVQSLMKHYPFQRPDIIKWHQVCHIEFPEYVKFWRNHPDVQTRTPLMQEQIFKVPHLLPSGRTVFLRGKWDSVDLVGNGIWVMENKSKGEIDEVQIKRQCSWDLQSLFYTVSLQSLQRMLRNGKAVQR